MARWLELAAAAGLGLSGAASAQELLPPVSPAEAVAAGRDCHSIPAPHGYDAAAAHLLARGWNRAEVRPRPGDDPAAAPIMFNKGFVLATLAPSDRGRDSGTSCMIFAAIEPSTRWRSLVEAATEAFGPPDVDQDRRAIWLAGDASVMMSHRRDEGLLTLLFVPGAEPADRGEQQ